MKKLFISFTLFFLSTSLAFAEQAQLTINGLVCDFCARALEKTFSKKEEVKNIDVNLNSGLITVNFNEGKSLDDEHLKKAVLDAGYNIQTIKRVKDAK